ncbi:hypothetical protein N7492_006364 [Penicillium capsulatum]|uniref:Uncharacterized protein n=1 Tax=Penicillium capsulatum TaxID=69766 RepID=A0A9W9I3E1_9EURO|nr:hypothetical protein N7492_006364 [Penicillium capsulatum]
MLTTIYLTFQLSRALYHSCKFQSILSRDEISSLYERVRMASHCLLDYDIQDGSPVRSPVAEFSASGDADSHAPGFIDPTLIQLDIGTRHQIITESTRSESQKPSSTIDLLDKSLRHTEARGSCASEKYGKCELPETSYCPDAADDSSRNEFDLFIREIGEMEASEFPPDSGESGGQWPERMGTDKDDLPVITPATRTSVCDPVERESDGMSPRFPTHEGINQVRWNQTGKTDAEEDAHRNSPNNAACDNPPLVRETSAVASSPDLCPFYPTPDSNPRNTPIPAGGRVKWSEKVTLEGNCSADRIANYSQSGRSLSNFRPAEEVALDDAEHVDLQDSFSNDSNFGNSDIESAIGEAHDFLQDTLSGVARSGTQNTVNPELNPKDPMSALASFPVDSNDQHGLSNHELADSSIESLECESRDMLRHKRKLPPALEPQSALAHRNLRPRFEKDCSEKQALHSRENPRIAGHTSFNGALAPSGATLHLKSGPSLPSRSDKDDWNGRFSHHPLLSGLSSDEKDEMERKCNRILRPDLPGFMEKHSKSWKSSGFWYSPSLDVPSYPNISSSTKGPVIWKYVEAIEAGEEAYYLKARFADIILYLEYVEEFNRQKKAGHPDQTAKTRATSVICGINSLPKAIANKTRKSFHEHKLVGERWWWSGCYLGHGFILLCSEETGKKVSTLACCSKFDEIVGTLLTDGEFPVQVSKKEVQQWIKDANAIHQESIPTIHWQDWSTNAVASKASYFLSARLSNRS